jgi:glycosyltransferase involved in cell wall biosynthesis
VVDGDNGFLVPPRSADAIAQAALRLLEQPALAAAMGRRARERVVEHYDAHRVSVVMLAEMGVSTGAPQQEPVHA